MAQKLDGDSIIECARNERGEKLLNMYGNYTNSLQPEHEYVPWVILDEVKAPIILITQTIP